VSDRATGALLFLPVPLVLWLFTQAPLGILASLALGVALVATHRLYARPFALARAARRCLWCGGAVREGPTLEVHEPLGRTCWRACSGEHERRLRRLFGFAAGHARFLRVGILGTLAVFLAATLAAGLGALGPGAAAGAVAFFRIGIALTVLPLGWLAVARGPTAGEPSPVPFPLHIQALIGSAAVLWLFRLVGLVWLGLGAWRVAAAFGVPPL
jgi:hypothetical protein